MSQLVDYVLTPVFFYLRFNGYPVPPACLRAQMGRHCPHVAADNEKSKGVHEEGGLSQPKTDYFWRNVTTKNTSDCAGANRVSNVPSREEVVCGSASGRKNLEFASKKNVKLTNTVERIPHLKTARKDLKKARAEYRSFDSVRERNSTEITSRKVTLCKTKSKTYANSQRSTQKVIGSTSATVDVGPTNFSADLEDSTKFQKTGRMCRKCRVVTVVTRIHGMFIGMLLFLNAARYTSIFYTLPSMDGQFVSALVFQLFFFLVALVYVFSTLSMRKFLPELIGKLQAYEETYGTAVDCTRSYKRTVNRCRFFFWFQAGFSMAFVVTEQTVFSSLQAHLAPFSHAEGLAYYLALAAFAVVLHFLGSVMHALLGLFALMSKILHTEFSCLTRELACVLPKTDHSAIRYCKNRHEKKKPREKGKNSSPAHYTFPCSRALKLLCLDTTQGASSSPVFTQRSHLGSSALSDTIEEVFVTSPEAGNYQKTDLHLNERRKLDSLADVNNLSSVESISMETLDEINITTSDQRNARRKDSKYSTLLRSHSSESNELVTMPRKNTNNDRDHTENESTRSDNALINHENTGSDDLGDLEDSRQESHLSQEEDFDLVHFKHQALCELVDFTNKCLRHLVFISYVNGLFLACLIIYGLASGALDLANIFFQGWNILYAAFFVTATTVFGIILNNAAHAPQDVIYAADWSKFSDRLLYKVQLFASRLGHTKIGYDVYGLFVIDKSTVLMVLGTLLTYTIVVIQFQQEGQPSCTAVDNSTIAR